MYQYIDYKAETSSMEDQLLINLKNDLKKQIQFKYEQALHNMEIAERMIFRFIPLEILAMPAIELQNNKYDLLKIINAYNEKKGVKEKRATFLPSDLSVVQAEIEEDILDEKVKKSEQKKAFKTGKKFDQTPVFKDGFLDRPATPNSNKGGWKHGIRNKTPTSKKAGDPNRPGWKF